MTPVATNFTWLPLGLQGCSLTLALLATGGALLTVWLVYRRVTQTTELLYLQSLRDRYQAYLGGETPISPDDVQIVQDLPEEYFDLDIYRQRYEDDPKAVRRYLSVLRRYHYVFYAYCCDQSLRHWRRHRRWIDTSIWIQELIAYPEFRDVHARFRRYYPTFGPYVDTQIARSKARSAGTPATPLK